MFIGHVWPEFTSTAASQNILSYVNFFVTLGSDVCFCSAAAITEYSFDFSSIGVTQASVQLNDDSFDTFVTQFKPDIVVFDRFLIEEQYAWRVAQAVPSAIRILDCEDLHCLRQARQKQYKKKLRSTDFMHTTPPKQLVSLDICKREIAAIFRCDLTIVLSDAECALLENVFNIPKSHLLTLRFLERSQRLDTPSFEQRKDFIMIGSFRHEPNWDAVLTLKQHIWPKIRKHLKTENCHVYGSYMTPKAKALENPKQGFFVHGYINDALQAIGHARIMLAPINFGAGIKGKLVDAMQVCTPSVTTPIGAESIASPNNWPGAVTHSHDEFIQRCISLYNDKEQWESMSNLSGTILHQQFNHQQLQQAFSDKIEDILDDIAAHRGLNFIGSMMLHHSMQSTKYMSQWIAAKNKNIAG